MAAQQIRTASERADRQENQRGGLGGGIRRELDVVEVSGAPEWAPRGNRLESEHHVLLAREGRDVPNVRLERSVVRYAPTEKTDIGIGVPFKVTTRLAALIKSESNIKDRAEHGTSPACEIHAS